MALECDFNDMDTFWANPSSNFADYAVRESSPLHPVGAQDCVQDWGCSNTTTGDCQPVFNDPLLDLESFEFLPRPEFNPNIFFKRELPPDPHTDASTSTDFFCDSPSTVQSAFCNNDDNKQLQLQLQRAEECDPITGKLIPCQETATNQQKQATSWALVSQEKKLEFAKELIDGGHKKLPRLVDRIHTLVVKTKSEMRERKVEAILKYDEDIPFNFDSKPKRRRRYQERRRSNRICTRCQGYNFNHIKEKIWCNNCYIAVHDAKFNTN